MEKRKKDGFRKNFKINIVKMEKIEKKRYEKKIRGKKKERGKS